MIFYSFHFVLSPFVSIFFLFQNKAITPILHHPFHFFLFLFLLFWFVILQFSRHFHIVSLLFDSFSIPNPNPIQSFPFSPPLHKQHITSHSQDLKGNCIRDRGAAALAPLLHKSHCIHKVNLSENLIRGRGGRCIFDAISEHTKTLSRISLAGNPIPDHCSCCHDFSELAKLKVDLKIDVPWSLKQGLLAFPLFCFWVWGYTFLFLCFVFPNTCFAR